MAEPVSFGVQVEPVAQKMAGLNRTTSRALTKFERDNIAKAKPIYIYNFSSIHEWDKPQGQLGTLKIRKREPGQRISEPTIIPSVVTRRYDKGFGKREPFQEDGMEVAMDICGCHPDYPQEAKSNDLTNFGVVILTKTFEEHSAKDQDRIEREATAKLLERLRFMILEADNWNQGIPAPLYKNLISSVHQNALATYNELTGEKQVRPWSTIHRAKPTNECQWCGSPVKAGVPVCPTCSRIVDEKLFAEMNGKK